MQSAYLFYVRGAINYSNPNRDFNIVTVLSICFPLSPLLFFKNFIFFKHRRFIHWVKSGWHFANFLLQSWSCSLPHWPTTLQVLFFFSEQKGPVMWSYLNRPWCFAENRYNFYQKKSTGMYKEKLSIIIPFINCSTYVQYGSPDEWHMHYWRETWKGYFEKKKKKREENLREGKIQVRC